jgi:hypothetical protein
MAFADGHFALSVVQSDGATLRQHLEVVVKQTGKIPEEYDFPDCPDALMYLWSMFGELCGSRSNTGYGMLPLQFAEIEAWTRLSHCPLLPWELRTIKMLDSALLASQVKGKPNA